MDAKMQAWRKRMPTKRQLTSTINHLVQQKSVAAMYTPTEQERIKALAEMIKQATSDYEADEDWDRILKVVDALSNVVNRAVLKESIRYLRLRLGDPSSRVVILSLTLTESIVKNCGDLVHQEIATEGFMGELEELYRTHANKRGRDSMEIASRVLDMIQAWGEAFLPLRHEFPLFVDTYHNMRKKGVKFPDQYDETKVPVLTPPPDVPTGSRGAASSNQSRSGASIDTSSYSNTSSGLGGLSTHELYNVATNVSEMFEDMLYEAQKDASAISSHGVMEELAVEVREIVHRMEGAIPIAVAEGDENLEKYLSINDELHAALDKYDALQSSNQSAEEPSVTSKAAKASDDVDLIDPFGLNDSTSPQDNQKSGDDDPFADFVRARTGSKEGKLAAEPKSAPVVAKPAIKVSQPENDEDDPFASFVQQRATKVLGSSGHSIQEESKPATPAAPAKDLIDLWDDVPAPSPVPAQPISKPDVWLGDDLLGSNVKSNPAMHPASPALPAQDLWNAGASTGSASFPPPASSTGSLGASATDPFSMLDFSTKTSISSPVSVNPFDDIQPVTPAQPHAQPQPPQQPASFNPFDF